MNTIQIKKIDICNKTVKCQYEVEGSWEKYFNKDIIPEITYDIDISTVPKSILIIPFVCNILPIVWLCNATLIAGYIDKDFMEHIEEIKRGYKEMFPQFNFRGNISAKAQQNISSDRIKKAAVFFSGGVDAFTTLFRHLEEMPLLLTIWGADISLKNEAGWNQVNNYVKKTAKNFQLDYIAIKSNFRTVINISKLNQLVKASGDGWWHAFQHGISIISHASPIAYLYGLQRVYIASSFPSSMKGNYVCASDPVIDNYVYFCGCRTIHDGYELNRQDKVHYLVSKVEESAIPIELRVCWESTGGENCCHCEKCYRTILEIISEGGDPNEYGFQWEPSDIIRCKKDMKRKITLPPFFTEQFYPIIQSTFSKNKEKIKDYDKYEWLQKIDFNKFNDMPIKKIRYCLIARGIKKMFRKISRKIDR